MNKFHAIPTTTADGIRHDSKAEASRWDTLKLRERAGEIIGVCGNQRCLDAALAARGRGDVEADGRGPLHRLE